jgi:hypothetical protein
VFRNSGKSPRPLGWMLVLLSLVLALGPSGCATKPPPAEPEVPRIGKEVKTIALAPLDSWIGTVKPEQVEAAFERRAVDHLERAGRTVVEPAVWKAIWRRYADDVGGLFDASTGKADEKKLATVREAVIRELVETRAIDGVLRLEVRPSEIYAVGGIPTVCGRATSPYWPSGWANRGGGRPPATIVRFSCLVGILVDPGGKELFARQAGIEGIETYDAQTRAVRPSEFMLRDDPVLDQAISVVLVPLDPPLDQPVEAPAE